MKDGNEKLAHLQHDQWLAHRPKPTASVIAKALRALGRQTGNPPDVGDELPDGYVSTGSQGHDPTGMQNKRRRA